ncbi:hypothetical protein HJC23_011935 [Cyclotella cryptica]|uniref:Uncharacterized protein n=1 Tax=Cyclotella cryptica TaxID=29204 RepID=A0ABD3QST9_9STRA|eukprot:CCRYP_002964-RA/>CCRYP_002964-RA protein AED:0.15 eAED:0.18 QI:0/0/0/1/1/1/2/0/447
MMVNAVVNLLVFINFTTSLMLVSADALDELIPGCMKFKDSDQCRITGESNNYESRDECLHITGFSDRDFAASGIYCRNDSSGPYQLRASDSLRYELVRQGSDRYELLRVIKSKRDVWTGIAIYAGFLSGSDSSLDNAEWYGYSLNIKHRESSFDPTEPRLNATYTKVDTKALRVANEFRSEGFDKCDLSICDSLIRSSSTNEEFCSHHWHASAQLADIAGNNMEAARRLEQARSCVLREIHDLASKQIPIPRHIRWEVSHLSHLMAKSLVKAGRLHAALDAILVGLANSPEQKQRRHLFLCLGDIKLAANELKSANQAYLHAFRAVLEKGGMVEKRNFWTYIHDSVGVFIAQAVSSTQERSSDLARAISPNYATIRMKMLLRIEKGDTDTVDWLDFEELNSATVDPMLIFGHECTIRSLNEIQDKFGFCSHYILDYPERLVEIYQAE